MKKTAAKQKPKRKVGRPPKSELGANEVRERILESAEHVFAEKGIHAAGLREIAKRSRHSLAIVTYYFKTKENLVLEVLDRHMKTHQAAIAGVLQKNQGEVSIQGLREIFNATLQWYGTEAGQRSYRIQSSARLDASPKMEARSKDYQTRSTVIVAEMFREINPSLNEGESLERAIILLALLRVRTELHWVLAEHSGQKRDRDTVVQGYEQWLYNRFLPMLIEEAKP